MFVQFYRSLRVMLYTDGPALDDVSTSQVGVVSCHGTEAKAQGRHKQGLNVSVDREALTWQSGLFLGMLTDRNLAETEDVERSLSSQAVILSV